LDSIIARSRRSIEFCNTIGAQQTRADQNAPVSIRIAAGLAGFLILSHNAAGYFGGTGAI
jgi:hypothetical protein